MNDGIVKLVIFGLLFISYRLIDIYGHEYVGFSIVLLTLQMKKVSGFRRGNIVPLINVLQIEMVMIAFTYLVSTHFIRLVDFQELRCHEVGAQRKEHKHKTQIKQHEKI